MFTLDINDRLAEPLQRARRAIAGGLQPRRVNAVVGRAAAEKTRAHLYALANTRHRGLGSLNFWEDAADSVRFGTAGGNVEVRVEKAGAAQRFYGGTIEPVNSSHLWIPIPGSEAEGRAPGEYSGDLIPIISALTGKGVALHKVSEKPLFALVKSVTQKADDSVLPTEDEYAEVAAEAVDALVERMRQRTEGVQ